MRSLFRALPSAEACLKALETPFPSVPRSILLGHVRAVLDEVRADIREGRITSEAELALPALVSRMGDAVQQAEKPHLRRVINGAGVVVHTNLGRSVLAREAQEAVQVAAQGYCNLEFDLETGERGSRMDLVEDLLCAVTNLCRVNGFEAEELLHASTGKFIRRFKYIEEKAGKPLNDSSLEEMQDLWRRGKGEGL